MNWYSHYPMNKSIKLINRYAWPRSASGALALGAALLVAPLGSAQDDEDENVYELSPFTVEGDESTGYRATSTLAGTRIRTDLKDVGTAISVVTEDFLEDTGSTDNESLLLYTLGTEVGGSQGNFAGGGDGGRVDTDSQRRNPSASNRVRGLAAADSARGFYATDIPWDSFNVDRIDIQRGPNSILFGLGSPAGVINANLKTAHFENGGDVGLDFGNDGTWRATVDYNQVLIEDELAVRFAALESDKGFQQDQAFEENSRIFFSAKWAPSFLKSEGSHGELSANYEDGDIMANRPRVLPPIDRITPWFDSSEGALNKGTFITRDSDDPDNLQTLLEYSRTGTPGAAYIGNEALGRIFNGPIAFYDGAGTPSYYKMAAVTVDGTGYNYLGIDDSKDAAAKAGVPFSSIGGYKSNTLSDPTIFDFYNNLLDGDNKREWQEWEAYNLTYRHTWLDGKLGLELGYDKQEYADGQVNIMDNWGQSISVDIVSEFPDGTPNPNVGRAMAGGETQNNFNDNTDRETFRLQGTYSFDFRDSGNDSLGFLGRHVFTGLYSQQQIDKLNTTWVRSITDGIGDGGSIDGAARYLSNVVYLSDDLSGRSSASGANISPINYSLVPHASQQTIVYNDDVATPFSVLSYDNGDIDSLYKQAVKSRDEIDSTVLVWQSWLFNDTLVPMYAYRDDSSDALNAGSPPAGPRAGSVLPYDRLFTGDQKWDLPGSPAEAAASSNGATFNSVGQSTSTYSLVWHAPQAIKDALKGTNVSLSYANSENFSPDASRRGIDGAAVPNQIGDTEEFGITLSSADGKLHFKVNRYETNVKNATLSNSSFGNSYMIGFGEGVARWGAKQAQLGTHGFQNNYALVDPESDFDATSNPLIDPNIDVLRYEPNPGEFPAPTDPNVSNLWSEVFDGLSEAQRQSAVQAALARQEGAISAVLDSANRPSAAIEEFWRQDWDAITGEGTWGSPDQDNAWAGEPASFAVTSDFRSKGTEYELFYQPTDNWSIVFNAAKTEAQRFNIASSYANYVKERWNLYKIADGGAYGDLKLYSGSSTDPETLRWKYGTEFYANYLAGVLINRSQVPELREWRANFITNYSFTDGRLAGLNVGGALRWQDEVAIGYPGVLADEAIEEFGLLPGDEMYDVNNPYMGPSDTSLDLWANYTIKLSDSVDWKIQLNVSNVTADDELIPVTVNVDGTPAASRIAPQRTWTIANTFSF
ncbi:TonB-dependent receptor plug domain protein [Verrucomicrobiia bacterium DG1235]|nr:TonB-dependent receptor plug domain protein [Verrucomicrobiae bacterium DG1235]